MEIGVSALATYRSVNRSNAGSLAAGGSLPRAVTSTPTPTPAVSSAAAPTALATKPINAPTSVVETQASMSLRRTNVPLAPTADARIDQDTRQVAGQVGAAQTAGMAGPESRARAEQTALEAQQIRQLAEVDREVRAHEAAHAAAGGQHAGAPAYEFTRGPDGRLYAVAGEVSIDTSPVAGDPQATIEKAQTLIRAATAPANPSPQDLRVAAEAQAMLVEAQAQLALEQQQGEEAQAVTVSQTAEAGERDSPAEEDVLKTGVPALSASDSDAGNSSLATEPQILPADAVNERLQRAREQREDFAEQLQELNQRLNRVQQQLINSGVISGLSEPGSFIDIQA